VADFNNPSGAGANLGEIEARLAAIKQSVAQLESRLQRDVAAESKGARPGRRATERAVRDELGPETTRTRVEGTRATEADTGATERNTRAHQNRTRTLEEELRAQRRATRLQQPVPPSVAAQQSRILPQAANAEQDAAALRRQVEAKRLLASLDGRMLTEQQAVNSALSQDIQKRELASQGLRKHGALTTEFISAAARGNVTLREMGFQVGATVGKFAGWTAAAGATYGALAAVTALGKGALDASSQVQILSNYITEGFDSDRASEQLRQLAQQFNLPVDQVGEAFQGMGKIFHDQESAFQATQAALYGVKVGELSAADSTKYLTAIVNGFHLPAERLATILDQVNQAQNNYGVAIKDTVAGTGQAAGAWRAAGGDLNQLLALIVTGEKVTGRSGVNIGTALQRSAEIIQRSPKSQEALRGYGIDPTQNITSIYQEAIRKVQSGQIKGPDVNKLASALATPQLSSRISPILQNAELYNNILRDTSPEASKGSAQRELENRLKAVSERAKEVGINLQAIGVELGRAGAFDAFGGLLITLNLTLKALTEVLSLVNELPKGVREAVVVAAELYGILRLIRRFRPPSLNAETGEVTQTGFLKQRPETFQRKTLQEAARNQVKFYQDEQERLARNLPTQRLTASTAVETRNAVAAREAAAVQAGSADAGRRLIAAETAATNSLARVAETEAQLAAVEARLIAAREAETAVSNSNLRQAKRQGKDATTVAREAGIYHQPGTTDRPTPDRPVPVAGGPGAAKRVSEEATKIARQEQEIAAAQSRFGGVTERVSNGFNRARGGIDRLASGLRGFAGSMGGLFTAGLITLFAADALKNYFENQGKKADRLGSGPQSQAEADRWREGDFGHSFGDLYDPTTDRLNRDTEQRYYDLQQQVINGRKPYSAFVRHRPTRYQQATSLFRDAPPLGSTQQGFGPDDPFNAPGPNTGFNNKLGLFGAPPPKPSYTGPVPFRFVGDIVADAKAVVDLYKQGKASRQEAQDAVHKALQETQTARGSEKDVAAGKRLLQQTRAVLGPDAKHHISLLQELKALSPKDLIAYVQGNTAAIEGLGTDKGNLGAAAVALRAAIAKGGAHPTGDQAKAIKAARDGVKATLAQIDQEYQEAVSLADGSAGAEARAFNEAKAKIGKTHGGKDAARQMQTLVSEAIAQASKDLQDDLVLARGDPSRIAAAYRRAMQKVKGTGNSRQSQVAQQQLLEQQFQQDVTNIDSSTNLAAARDPANAIGIRLRGIGQKIAAAIRTFGRNSNQVQDLIAQQYDLQKQAVDEQVALINANTSVAQATAKTPAGEARAAVSGALAAYNAMKASGKYKPSELRAAYGQYLAAVKGLHQQLRADAQAYADSVTALALSRTDDPVKQATIQLQAALRNLRRAQTPTERNQALAAVNTARRNRRQTIQQGKYDDIEYYASIGKLTADAEIQSLEALEKSIKGNKNLRRQIKQRIYQLKQQLNSDANGLDLNLDNIKLPTTYEIRRAVLGGGPRRSNITVHNRPTVNVEVNDPGAADAVYTAIEDTLGTSLTAARRAGR
jgi:TP901 family phage tail tape measure protein